MNMAQVMHAQRKKQCLDEMSVKINSDSEYESVLTRTKTMQKDDCSGVFVRRCNNGRPPNTEGSHAAISRVTRSLSYAKTSCLMIMICWKFQSQA